METAIITGASSGIGAALAKQLACNNIQVYAISRNQEALHDIAAGLSINPIVADITTKAGQDTIARSLADCQQIDYLIHNAGVGIINQQTHTLTDVDIATFRRNMAVHTTGPILLTRLLLKQMHQSKILYITAGAAKFPLPIALPYVTSKFAAMKGFSDWKLELMDKHVYLSMLNPGRVDTPAYQASLGWDDAFPAIKKMHENSTARLLSAEEVANYITHLLINLSHEEYSEREIWDIYEDQPNVA